MGTIRVTCVAALAALSAPALAQEQSWETTFLLIANPCFESAPANKLTTCQQANTNLLNKAASYVGPMLKHDDNVYRAMRAMLFINIGAEMGRIDGVRSRRSCEVMEQAWSDAALIDTQYSPQRVSELQGVRTDVLKAVRMCRQDFGKLPSWAPELPAS